MLSDIYGEDKKEKFVLIKRLIRDSDRFVGVLWGKEGIGKKFLVQKAVESIKKENDIFVFVEATDSWFVTICEKVGLEIPLSKEEFIISFTDFLENFKGRLFIIFDNIQNLTEKQIKQILHILGQKEKVYIFLIGDEGIKEKLVYPNIGKTGKLINVILYCEKPSFEEFFRYFKDRYKQKINKRYLKKLYSETGGSIQQAEKLLSEGYTPEKRTAPYIFIFFLFIFLIFILLIYLRSEKAEKNGIKDVVDMKLPVEGRIKELPIKTKKVYLKPNYIRKAVKENLKLEEVPPLKFFKKRYSFYIQVASFKNRKNAEIFKNKMEKLFKNVSILEKKNGIRSVVIYVYNKEEAQKVIRDLKKMNLKPILKKVK